MVATNTQGLTGRQLQVLELIAEGYTAEEVGKIMFLSSKTVKKHTSEARWHLRARNTTHAVTLCYRMGLLSITGGGDTYGAVPPNGVEGETRRTDSLTA